MSETTILIASYRNEEEGRVKLTKLEQRVWNHGERLIPGRTHNAGEVRRHKSSYEFFRQVILRDIEQDNAKAPSILELGFGAGFGAAMLADIPESSIYAVDIGEECLEYATANYHRPNIEYMLSDIPEFLKQGNHLSFDYVVSRGVLEHIENGLDMVIKAKWAKRLMFDVPYAELPRKNGHHVLKNITEKDFVQWPSVEILYETINGVIFSKGQKPPRPNMIMGVMSHGDLPSVSSIFDFPIPSVGP